MLMKLKTFWGAYGKKEEEETKKETNWGLVFIFPRWIEPIGKFRQVVE